MVCADKNIIKSGIAEKVEGLLKEGGAEVLVFPDGRPDINLELIESAGKIAREFTPEVMVGVGGGSNMDLAKWTAVIYKYGGRLTNYTGVIVVQGSNCDEG